MKPFAAEILFLNPDDVADAKVALTAVGCDLTIDPDAKDPYSDAAFGMVVGVSGSPKTISAIGWQPSCADMVPTSSSGATGLRSGRLSDNLRLLAMTTRSEASKKIPIQADVKNMRAVLKRTFPATKFSARLSDNSIQFQWTGDCPTERQVEDTLLENGCAQLDRDYGWRQLKTREGYFLSFYTRRPAPAYEVTARRAKSLITKTLKKQFPKTRFTLRACYGSTTSPILFIEWLNGPQEDEVSTLVQLLSNGVRIAVTRDEPCDLCGARTIACLRGKTCEDEPTGGLLVCLDCEVFGRWARFKRENRVMTFAACVSREGTSDDL